MLLRGGLCGAQANRAASLAHLLHTVCRLCVHILGTEILRGKGRSARARSTSFPSGPKSTGGIAGPGCWIKGRGRMADRWNLCAAQRVPFFLSGRHFSSPLGVVLKPPRSTISPSSLSVQNGSRHLQGQCRSSSQSWAVCVELLRSGEAMAFSWVIVSPIRRICSSNLPVLIRSVTIFQSFV